LILTKSYLSGMQFLGSIQNLNKELIMIPIFFPTTYISQSSLDFCQEWFEQICIYQPSDINIPEHYQTNERLIIRTPLTSQFDRQKFEQEKLYLNALIRESGPNLAHLKARSEDLPFFDESSVNRIRAQIKHNRNQTVPAAHKELLIALYCHLFQELDMQQADLDSTLAEIDNSHSQLFQQLNNDLSNHSPQSTHTDKKLLTQIQDRLKVWFYLYQYDQEKSDILVTDNPDVMIEIQEWNDDLEQIYCIDQSQMANAKQLLQDYLGIQLHQLSLTPVSTKNIAIYYQKNSLVGPFIPSSFTTCKNIRFIVLDCISSDN